MATTINGSRVDWKAYEFGITNGQKTIVCEDCEDAREEARYLGKPWRVVMRAVYETAWGETL